MDTTKTKPSRSDGACQEALMAYAMWLMKQPPKQQDKRFHWIGNRAPALKN